MLHAWPAHNRTFESTHNAVFDPAFFKDLKVKRERCAMACSAVRDMGVMKKTWGSSAILIGGKYIQQHLFRYMLAEDLSKMRAFKNLFHDYRHEQLRHTVEQILSQPS